jgi:hypothetical protein
MSAAVSPTRPGRIVAGRLPRAAALAAVAAAVANAIVFFITIGLGVDLNGPFMGPDAPAAPLSVVQVIIASAVPVIGAALLLWALARFTPRPIPIFVAAGQRWPQGGAGTDACSRGGCDHLCPRPRDTCGLKPALGGRGRACPP